MAKIQGFEQLFLHQLKDIYNAEHQVLEILTRLIKSASLTDIQETLKDQLKETRQEIIRLESIFTTLDVSPGENVCKGMAGLSDRAESLTQGKTHSALLDASLVSTLQKIIHYKIAAYGTLKSFASQLKRAGTNYNMNDEVIGMLDANLQDEVSAVKKLTRIAEGDFFACGINREAAQESKDKKMKST